MEGFSNSLGLLRDKLLEWLEQGILLLPNAVLALLILLAFYILAHYFSKAAKGVLVRLLKNISLVRFLGAIVRLAILFIGLAIALNILQLDRAVVSLLAGVGIIGIALGFAFQDMASNFIAGVVLVFRDDRPFKADDLVDTNGHFGIIHEINLRDTTLQTLEGQTVFIPNRKIFEQPVVNYTLLRKRRVDLAVGVSYADNLEKVREVTLEAIHRVRGVLTDSIDLYYEAFADSSINFVVRFWIPFRSQPDYLAARSEAIIEIKKAFDANNITIPWPIRTLDFGIKGGRTLADMLGQRE